MTVLWPKGIDGDIAGLRVIDTGTLLGYHSIDDKSFYNRLCNGSPNPDCLCVPLESESVLHVDGNTYRYSNRYYVLLP
jgi:hypothetical protein